MRGLVSLICLSAVLLAGCGGGSAATPAAVDPAASGGWSVFPAPSELLRSISATPSERYATGSQASAALPQNRFAADGALGMFGPDYAGPQATLADAAYAGYQFELPGYDGPAELHLLWDTAPAAADLWLGLGSFDEDCWKWFNPAEPGLFNLDYPEPYFSPGGEFMVMVVVLGQTGAGLSYIGMGEPPGLWLVNAAAPAGGDGLSWDTAFSDLQDALAVAQPGDEVWVAAGCYRPGDSRLDSFVIGDSVAVYGGFTGTETERSQRDWVENTTLLSGDIGEPAADEDNSIHVVITGAGCVLDGLTISDGNANGPWDGTDVAGGLLVTGPRMTLANCEFWFNSAAAKGGAIYFDYGWTPDSSELTGCRFEANSAGEGGGALFLNGIGSLALEDCTFRYNASPVGGAVHSESSFGVDFTGCEFHGNSATDDGGGLSWHMGSGSLTGCTLTENTAGWFGGAIYSRDAYLDVRDCLFEDNVCTYSSGGAVNTNLLSDFAGCTFLRNTAMDGGALATTASDTVLVNCRFLGNSAQDEGGAIYAYASAWPVFLNCLFAGNTAGTAGGAIYSKGESDFALINSTLTANAAGHGGGLYSDNSRPWIANSVFHGNDCLTSGPEIAASGSYTPSYHCCDIAGSGGSGGGWNYNLGHDRDGNIDADPLFATPPDPGLDLEWGTPDDYYGALALSAGSPCIDAGDNSELDEYGIGYDLAKLLRFVDDLLTPDTGYGEAPIVDIGAFEFQ